MLLVALLGQECKYLGELDKIEHVRLLRKADVRDTAVPLEN